MGRGVLETGIFSKIESLHDKAQLIAQAHEELVRRFYTQDRLEKTLDPLRSLNQEYQDFIEKNGWSFGEFSLGQKLTGEVDKRLFYVVSLSEKPSYTVICPPIFDKNGSVLRHGTLA